MLKMESCSTHIVECLKSYNIYPKAFTSGMQPAKYPDNILHYDTSTSFSSNYQIASKNEQGWLYNWKTTVSTDLSQWIEIDKQTNKGCGSIPNFVITTNNRFRYLNITDNFLHNPEFFTNYFYTIYIQRIKKICRRIVKNLPLCFFQFEA